MVTGGKTPGIAVLARSAGTAGPLDMSTDRPVSTVAYAEELIRRIRENDPQAFDELYSRYSPRVFGYLFQRLNGNVEEAEDLTRNNDGLSLVVAFNYGARQEIARAARRLVAEVAAGRLRLD